jgi:hypothetical protein
MAVPETWSKKREVTATKQLLGKPSFLVAALLCLYAAAWGLPMLVPDGTSGLSGGDLRAARLGQYEARHVFWENEMERVWARRFRIVSIVSGAEMTEGSGWLTPGCQVRARAYTFFALPYSAAIFYSSGGSVEYRLPTGPIRS